MKELDKESSELQKDLLELENTYLANAETLHNAERMKITISGEQIDELTLKNAQTMQEINNLRNRCKQKLSEKTAIASNLTNIIDRFNRKLDTDLAFFETELKGCGDFETPKGAEPGSEVMKP
jgi:hypothetical protein